MMMMMKMMTVTMVMMIIKSKYNGPIRILKSFSLLWLDVTLFCCLVITVMTLWHHRFQSLNLSLELALDKCSCCQKSVVSIFFNSSTLIYLSISVNDMILLNKGKWKSSKMKLWNTFEIKPKQKPIYKMLITKFNRCVTSRYVMSRYDFLDHWSTLHRLP